MKIINALQEKIFRDDSDFLDKLANRWHHINSHFLYHHGQKNPQPAFLSILTEEIYKKLPSCKILPSVKLNRIEAFSSEERAEKILGMHLEDVRKKLCWETYRNQTCRSQKCFAGYYPNGTEVDALIICDENLCFLEYENKRSEICDNFMKIYRLRRLLNKEFESLFVTNVTTTKQREGYTTFGNFNKYIDDIKPILDSLLVNWKVLEIVDLFGSERKRRFSWKP